MSENQKELILSKLLEGNSRFAKGEQKFRNLDKDRRLSLVNKQNPKAIILSCSDSRVPAEMVFDQGLGDLFMVRVAGNVYGEEVLESIEYAVEFLGVELLIVLGHTNCGAITSAVDDYDHNKRVHFYLRDTIASCPSSDDFINDVAKKNALLTAEKIINSSSIISESIKNDKIGVFSAFYDLESGLVSILE